MIAQDTIRTIIDTAHIEEVISDFVNLKKRGANYIGLCPFHNEKTPSFTVSPSKGIFKCFGCGKAGDTIRFIMEHDQLSYPDALRFLAARYNIEIEETFSKHYDKESADLRESLYLVNEFAAKWFAKNLWDSEKGKAIALTYLMDRGFDEKTLKLFQVGYSPEERGLFSKAALESGYKEDLLEKTGLCIKANDRLIDRFSGRIVFPIHNLSGRVIAFGGRTLRSDKKTAKYVNSPESEIYSKSHQLFGLHHARKAIVEKDCCYIVEGYTDVVSLSQSGVVNAAAPLGTSLTEDQVKLINRYTKNTVLLFDGDEAGSRATLRAIDMLLSEGMNANVVTFPEGQDPDSFSKERSDEELREFLKNNEKDFISYQLSVQEKDWNKDPVKKGVVLKVVLNSIAQIPDHLMRSLFVKDFSQKTGVEERSAIFEVNRMRRNIFKRQYSGQQVLREENPHLKAERQEFRASEKGNKEKKEEKVIELLFKYGCAHLTFNISHPESKIEEVTMLVAEYIVDELDKDNIEFVNGGYDKVYQQFRDYLQQGVIPVHNLFLEHGDEDVRNITYEMMSNRHYLSENWERKYRIYTNLEEHNLKSNINRALYALKLSEVLERLEEFEGRMKEAGEEELGELMRDQRSLNEAKKALADKLGRTLT